MPRTLPMIVASLVLGTTLLTACTPVAPVASPAPTGPPSAAPTPTPTPEPSVITIAANEFIVDGPGAPEHFDYFAPTEAVVASLTSTFGFEPVVTEQEFPNSDLIGYTEYAWNEFSWTAQDFAEAPRYPGSMVSAESATVGDVEIVTSGDVHVGDSPADPELLWNDPARLALESFTVGELSPGVEAHWVLAGILEVPEGPIVRLVAPLRDFP